MILLNVLKTFIATIFAALYLLVIFAIPSIDWQSALFIAVPFYFLGNLTNDYCSAKLMEAFNDGDS